jgi:hypothetical protein
VKPAARKRPPSHIAQVHSAATNSWAIIAIDGTPLRKKAQRAYQKALRDLDAAKAQLNEFHERDQPAYSRWISRNFGALLTEIRELESKLFEAQQLVVEVEQEYFFGGRRSIASAYREVMRRRAQPEPQEPADNPAGDEEEEDEFRREFEAFEKTIDDFWARIAGDAHEHTQNHRQEKAKAASPSSRRLKELYRTLARRLHPDKAADLTPSEKEWWHQTQEAYETGNLEQMEMIFTLVDIQDNGTRETSISALAKLTAGFKTRLRALKRQLTKLRRDAAWNFSQRNDHSILSQNIQASLNADRQRIASLLSQYRTQIAQWERAPIPPSKPARPRRRTPSGQRDFWF